MKTRRSLSTVVVLSLLVGLAGGLVGGSSPALAVVSIASSSSTTVPYSGTLNGPPEAVFLSGFVVVAQIVVRDPDFGKPPTVVLSLDFSNVVGKGQTTGTKYVASGNQVLRRPLVKTDVVDVIFPIFPSVAVGMLSARPALASFTFNYDTTTGTPTGASSSPTVDASTATQPPATM